MTDEIPILAPPQPIRPGDASQLDAVVAAAARSLPAEGPLTVVVNDPQRATNTPAVLERLRAALPHTPCRMLVATGTHQFGLTARRPFERKLHAAWLADEIAWHDCSADNLATVPGERPWRCHPWLLAQDGGLLAIGSCEVHYFAGITGAHKTVTIGCAALADVEANHAGALSPDSRPGRLAGNPVHEGIAAMARGLEAFRPVVAVNLLQAGEQVLGAEAGGVLDSLERIAPMVRSACIRTIPRPADALVLETDEVLGRSFYQADKAIKNNEWAVRDGGVLVLAADCPDGVGQDHFMALLGECEDHASAAATVRRRGYRLGDHKAVKLRYLTDVRGVRVFAVSGGLSAEACRVLGFTPAASPAAALASADIDLTGPDVYRVPDACNTCVTVQGDDPQTPPPAL